MRPLVLLLAALAPAAAAAAAPAGGLLDRQPAELWLEAKSAYEAGEYGRAVELYGRLEEAGLDGGRLHYNLGNAHLRSGELGRAIASYLRSRARMPRDEDLAANLDFARRSVKDAIAPPEPSPLVATLLFWHFSLSSSELAWLAGLINLLLWSALALRLYRPAASGATGAAWVLAVLLLVVGGSLAWRLIRPTRIAVVLPPEVPAYTAPDTDSVVRFKLHAGSELRLRSRRDGWLRIALPGGEQGWIQSDWAEVVEI